MPAPPKEFVAIQVSRLNEALLVAYSAMSDTNLKAVDRVVKIVRELDRYHGFAAEGRRLPETPRIDAPTQGAMTFGAALVCSAKFEPEGIDTIRLTAPVPLSPLQRGEGWPPDSICGEGHGRLAAVASHPAPHPGLLPEDGQKGPARAGASVGDDRPGIPPQDSEKVESAPAAVGAPEAGHVNTLQGPARASESAKAEEGVSALDARPMDRSQLQSGDLIARSPQGDEAIQGNIGRPAASGSPRFARDDGGRPLLLDTPHWPCERPENAPQTSDNAQSAPGNGRRGEAAPAPGAAWFDTPMVLTPTGWRRPTMRMALNGVAAS